MKYRQRGKRSALDAHASPFLPVVVDVAALAQTLCVVWHLLVGAVCGLPLVPTDLMVACLAVALSVILFPSMLADILSCSMLLRLGQGLRKKILFLTFF